MTTPLDQAILDTLLESVGDDEGFVDEVIDVYLDEAPRQVAEIRAALQAGSVDAVVPPAHALKGSSATIGGVDVARVSRELEVAARAGEGDGLADRLAELEIALEALVLALADARARRWRAP